MVNIKYKKVKKYKILQFVFLLIFFPLSSERCGIFKINYYNEITITINQTGKHYILSKGISGCSQYSGPMPDEVYINGQSQNEVNPIVKLTAPENNITLRWNSLVTNCSCMFNCVSNISKYDVSKFDTSKVINMRGFFWGLNLLTSLDFSNFHTSSVKNMQSMFCNCKSLISLDLRNFNTSSVTNMYEMFYYCTSLISLDLRNFDTSSVKNMEICFSVVHR